MQAGTAMLAVLTMSTLVAGAVEVTLDPRAIGEAIAIGQSRIERDRSRFHSPYRLVVNRAPVDYVEVITPFRKVVLAAEGRAQLGDRSFGQRQAFDLLAAGPPDLELHVELTFHPLNTFVGVPDYAVRLVDPRAGRVEPRSVDRVPRHEPRVSGMPLMLPVPEGGPLPRAGEPLLGGTIIARFDLRPLTPAGVYDVTVEDRQLEVARTRVDLSRLR